MSIISTLVKNLQPLKLYSLNKSSNVYKELSVYASELELLNDQLEELLKECFVQTAETYGLDNIEHIYMEPATALDTETRRQRIINRLQICDNDYTVEGVTKAIKCFGTENFSIIEYPQRNQLVVEVFGDYTDFQAQFIKTEIEKLIPADNTVLVYFNGISWSEFESKNLTFAQIDTLDYTWKTIDNQK